MTKQEMEDRIDALWDEVFDNDEENRFMRDEIDRLNEQLKEMENE